MREVFERLESLGVPYYLTGSEALARYGQPRQTMDVDVVVAIAPARFGTLARAFETDFVVNEPIDVGGFSMASLVARSALGKADLILGRDDPWSRAALDRRERWDHPLYGALWVISLEDLLLAKLERSNGVSELQLRDCRVLISLNAAVVDWPYVDRWATDLGVRDCSTRCAMRPDPGRADLLARVGGSSVEDRVAWLAAMRDAGMRSVWQQGDRSGIIDPIEIGEFLLRRLYPAESEAWFERVLAQLRAAHKAGAWTGFVRPTSSSSDPP